MSDKFQPQGPPVPAPPVALPLPLGASTYAAQTDGTQQTIVRGGAKGGTVAATVTSTSVDANHQGLDVYATALPLPTGAATETGNLASILARFAAATALADAEASATTMSRIGARLSAYNGATWDMLRSGLTAIQTSVVGIINTLPIGKYNSTQPTLADTNAVTLQVDSRGNLRVASMIAPQAQDDYNQVIAVVQRPLNGTTYVNTLYTYFAGAVTAAVIGAAGSRQGFTAFATNRNASPRYLILGNKASVLTAGALPAIALVMMIPANGSIALGADLFGPAGVNFPLGLSWAISTTPGSFTDAATNSEHEVIVQYL